MNKKIRKKKKDKKNVGPILKREREDWKNWLKPFVFKEKNLTLRNKFSFSNCADIIFY